ncbi:conserved hypothetical protein [Methanocella paludicola SANAE]|uniref:Uncharacterized protein n=1 Tax=Methanocella paludicola (strain DSM 17711 / JCM 13418 / NBRC 101707 / SANAE) TaxID=304371 RepID=D1YZ87_METPS|nr:hypothetical protein [Methanocella paludicola]BAI61759.1 conserved hypothetical protein [Methanocella paludicola SANAE]
MSKVIKGLLLVLAIAMIAVPASANLVATSFGFPVIVQSGTTSAFNQDTAFATDFETVDINFPVFQDGTVFGPTDGTIGTVDPIALDGTANVLPFGPVNLAFPSISQTVEQTQEVTHTDFAQTNEFAEFAYPFVGVGGCALPGFGFGW